MRKNVGKGEITKAYEQYVKTFTPKPTYFKNSFRAFVIGGGLCTIAYYFNNLLQNHGIKADDAATFVTLAIIMVAQLLTGFGVFDTIAKIAGAGVIVPISGFANAMVAPAIEYKKEGPVLGAGAKLFTVAGPVLVCGIAVAAVIGLLHWAIA